MIYILLENDKKSEHSLIQSKIIDFVKKNIRYKFTYQIIFCPEHIIESSIEKIDSLTDIIIWHPFVAYSNMELVKKYLNSIVILDKPSVYLQKISKHNPINENVAINNRFFILYLNPDEIDVTNTGYKLVVKNTSFILTIQTFLELIMSDDNNAVSTTEQEEVLEINNQIIKNQITLE